MNSQLKTIKLLLIKKEGGGGGGGDKKKSTFALWSFKEFVYNEVALSCLLCETVDNEKSV